MTKAEMIEDLLADVVSGDCPVSLRGYVTEVVHSFSFREVHLLHSNLERFTVTCESDGDLGDHLYGKLFFEDAKLSLGDRHIYVNIFPGTLRECPRDVRYVVCHEFGHLLDELSGFPFDRDLGESRADEFAWVHGFRPEKLGMLSGFNPQSDK